MTSGEGGRWVTLQGHIPRAAGAVDAGIGYWLPPRLWRSDAHNRRQTRNEQALRLLEPILVTRNCDVAPRSATAESLTTPSLCLDNLVLFPPNSLLRYRAGCLHVFASDKQPRCKMGCATGLYAERRVIAAPLLPNLRAASRTAPAL